MLNRLFYILLLFSISISASFTAHAQKYPDHPVVLTTAFSPGGPSDLLARIVARKMTDILGQPVVVEAKIGNQGNLAGQHVAGAEPDGYSILLGNNSIMASNRHLFKDPGYDSLTDFTPIGRIGTQPNILVVNPDLPVETIDQLVALAKSKPGEMNFGSSGVGNSAHLSAVLLNAKAGIDIVPIPYRGSSPALQDVIAGEVDIMFATSASVIGHIKSGAVRPIAVTTSERSAQFPDLPTMAELGYPDFSITTWHGLVAPAGTPDDIIEILNKALLESLEDPGVQKSLEDLGVDVAGTSSAEFSKFIQAEIPRWQELVEISGAEKQ